MTRALFLAPFLAVLGGCAGEPLTEVRIDRLQIPSVLLTCAPEPPVPPKPRTREDLGRYVTALVQAHQDCLAKVESIRELQGKP